MATNVVKTYLNAVKPVGEKIPFNYVSSVRTAVDDDFDFIIDNNYYVSGLELTKTGADAGATIGDRLTALVLKVDDTGALTTIAQAQFAVTNDGVGGAQITGALGQKALAGNPVPIPSAGAAVTVVPVAAPATDGTTLATYLNPTVAVKAESTVAGTTNAKQRIRLKIKSELGGAAVNPLCFVTIKLQRYAYGITQGSTGTNGNQLSETLIPNLP